MTDQKFTCPCCGYKTFSIPLYGSFSICPVCFWEDDPSQLDDQSFKGGSNRVSLIQAQKNFIDFVACEWEMKIYVRGPLKDEPKDENWKPF